MSNTKVRDAFKNEILNRSCKKPKDVANYFLWGGLFDTLFLNNNPTLPTFLSELTEAGLEHSLIRQIIDNKDVNLGLKLPFFKATKYLQALETAFAFGLLDLFLIFQPQVWLPIKVCETVALAGLSYLNFVDAHSRVKQFELLADNADNETVNVSNGSLYSRLALNFPKYTSGIKKYSQLLLAGGLIVGGATMLVTNPLSFPVVTNLVSSGSLILGGLIGGAITNITSLRENQFYTSTANTISARYVQPEKVNPYATPSNFLGPNPPLPTKK